MENRRMAELSDSRKESEGLTISNLLDETSTSRLPMVVRVGVRGGHAVLHSAIQAPVTGVTEIADQCFGSSITSYANLIPEPPHPADTSERAAEAVGSMVGTIAPLLLLHLCVRRTGNMILGPAEHSLTPARRLISEAAVTGVLFDGLLRPTGNSASPDFLKERCNNAITGGSTFAVMVATGIGAKGLGKNLEQYKMIRPLASLLRSETGSMTVAGLAAGLVNSEVHTLLNYGSFASSKDVAISMGSFAALGGSASLAGRFFGTPSFLRTEKTHTVETPQKPNSTLLAYTEWYEDASPVTRLEKGLSEYAEVLQAKGFNSSEAKAVRAQYESEPNFLELSAEAEDLYTGLLRRSPNKPVPFELRDAAATDLGEALENYAELMHRHGPRSQQAEAFLRQNSALPEFKELALECRRLELLSGKDQGIAPALRMADSKPNAAVISAGSARRLTLSITVPAAKAD